jgi:uncharacterized protein (DUF305 family)
MRPSRPHRGARPLPTRLFALVAALLAGLVALGAAACGTDEPGPDASASPPQAPNAPIPPDADYGGSDVVFAQETRRLLAQAMEMATLAETRATGAEVRTLAAKAKEDRAEVAFLLERWLTENKQPVPSAAPTEGQAKGKGLATPDEMALLSSLKGEPFDRLFLQMLIVNDQAAATLLTAQQWSGRAAPLMNIAHHLSNLQKVELAQARRLLGR